MLILTLTLLCSEIFFAQENRLDQLKLKLERIIIDSPGLSERVDINVNNVLLPDFLRAVASTHSVNLNINADLNSIVIANNFSNSTVLDVLLFVCKEYNLTIDFTGNILSIKKVTPVKIRHKKRVIPISYDKINDLFSVDLKKDTLFSTFKMITNLTGKNLVFAPGLEHLNLNAYIKEMPFDSALDKIAFANNLTVTKTRDNYYLFDKTNLLPAKLKNDKERKSVPRRQYKTNYYFKIVDSLNYMLDVDFEDIAIATIIKDIGYELNIDMFTSTPLDEAGNVAAGMEA